MVWVRVTEGSRGWEGTTVGDVNSGKKDCRGRAHGFRDQKRVEWTSRDEEFH